MFSFFKKPTVLSGSQEHAGHSGGHAHGGGCCGGGGHSHGQHDTEKDASSTTGRESSVSDSASAARKGEHVHA